MKWTLGLLKKSTFFYEPSSCSSKTETLSAQQLIKTAHLVLSYAAFASLLRLIVVAVKKLCILTFSIPRHIARCRSWRHFASAFTPSTIHLCRAYNQ